jgi:chromosome segregation ATPase
MSLESRKLRINLKRFNIKSEDTTIAKELISKTKKMIETLPSEKTSFSPSRSLTDKRNLRIDEDDCLKSNLNMNLQNLSLRLLEKTKQIKYLEKESKEKDKLISSLHNKLEKKTREIEKLNELMCQEHLSKIKSELCSVNRKLNDRESIIEENKNIYENTLNNLKKKLNKIVDYNDHCLRRIKELEALNDSILEENRSHEQDLKKIEINLRDKDQNYQDECENNRVICKELEDNKDKIKSMIKIIQNLFYEESNRKESHEYLINKLEKLFN